MSIASKLFHSTIAKGAEMLFMVEKLAEDQQDEQKRRYAICQSNAGGCYDEKSDRCRECGCYMRVKTGLKKHKNVKALSHPLRVEITHCPLAKWDGEKELEIVNYYRAMDNLPIIKSL